MKGCAMVLAVLFAFCGCAPGANGSVQHHLATDVIELPPARQFGDIALEEALLLRRSVRQYSDEPLALVEVAQLLWAGQGVTAEWGGRTAPSAGALYPLEVYLVAARVNGIAAGLYHYDPYRHALLPLLAGDLADSLSSAALGQACVREAPLVLVVTAQYGRVTPTYGDRGVRYAQLEAGHAAQNVCLQATALGLGSVVVGAFDDEEVMQTLSLPVIEVPLYLIPIGGLVDDG